MLEGDSTRIEIGDYIESSMCQRVSTQTSYLVCVITFALEVAKHSLVTFLLHEPREVHLETFSFKG